MKKMFFATSFIKDHSINRYQSWCDYYLPRFSDYDFYLFNDGPLDCSLLEQLDKKVTVTCYSPHLGRPSHHFFPGWIRSFTNGLQFSIENNYDVVTFVESDLLIRPEFIDKYKQMFLLHQYMSGFSNRYHIIETSIQNLNPRFVRQRIIGYYRIPTNFEKVADVEVSIIKVVCPSPVFLGERYENGTENCQEYLAQYDWDKYEIHKH